MSSIDVAVPCYQYGRYLRDCISSIQNQDVPNLRILIIDNASTDNSLEIARHMAASDARIEVVAHERNLGPNRSYNEAIDWASATYFLLLDADDMLAPGCLERAIDVLDRHPEVNFCHGVEARLYPDGSHSTEDVLSGRADWRIQSGALFTAELARTPVNRIGAPTVVRRTMAQKKIGHYRASLPFTDDLEMWLRLATTGDVAETNRIQAVRRIHDHQMTTQFKSEGVQVRDFIEREAAFESFFRNEGRDLNNARALSSQVRRGLAEHAYWSAISHFVRGFPRTGLELLKYAIRHRPISIFLPPFGWIFRMNRPLHRIGDVLLQAFPLRTRRSV